MSEKEIDLDALKKTPKDVNFLGIETDPPKKEKTLEDTDEHKCEMLARTALKNVGELLMRETKGDFELARAVLVNLSLEISEAIEAASAVTVATEIHKPKLEKIAKRFNMNGGADV